MKIIQDDIVLQATGIAKYFGGVTALSDGNLVARSGRVTGLLGANGSGKSTISKIICGVYRQNAGTVTYLGEEVRFKDPDHARRDGVSMVFQHLSLIPTLTVWQNIILNRESRRGPFRDDVESRRRAMKALSRLADDIDIDARVSDLAPGDAQIVEIAKATESVPRVLILDEPTAALTQAQVDRLLIVIREFAREGTAIVFTSHRLREVFDVCDGIMIFRNGKSVADIDFSHDGKNEQEVLQHIAGNREVATRQTKGMSADGDDCFSVVHLADETGFLRDIYLSVRRGEIVGIGGLAGQGQTELIMALAGETRIIEGQIFIEGEAQRIRSPLDAIRHGIVLVPGDRHAHGLFLDHTVYENLVFPRIASGKHMRILPLGHLSKEANHAYQLLGIKASSLHAPTTTLSGGNQQKIVLGKWIAFDIRVLLLSDLTKGVDVGAKQDLFRFVIRRVEEHGTGVVLYSTDNDELLQYCDRILIMHDGKIVDELSGDRMTEGNITAASFGVTDTGAVK